MAQDDNTFDLDINGGYQGTQTYKVASPEMRRQINRYKKEFNISDEHMFLILFEKDMEALPESQRTKGDTATNAMLVVGFLLLWGTLQSAMNAPGGANVPLIFLSVASFLLVCVVFYTGMLNPYKRTQRELKKRLKRMPEVPDFDDWILEHPAKAVKAPAKGKRRRR